MVSNVCRSLVFHGFSLGNVRMCFLMYWGLQGGVKEERSFGMLQSWLSYGLCSWKGVIEFLKKLKTIACWCGTGLNIEWRFKSLKIKSSRTCLLPI